MNEPANDPQRPAASGRRVVAVLGVLFGIGLALTLLAAVVLPRYVEGKKAKTRLACTGRLKALGLAAREYAQDRGGLLPHVRAADALDGDPSTPDTPRVFRSLLRTGYLHDPAQLVCPAHPRPVSPAAERAAERAWLLRPEQEPDADLAPSLIELEEVSYGWVRRAVSTNDPGGTLLAADKAVFARRGEESPLRGNHVDGWLALSLDGQVRWLSVHDEPFPGSYLAKCRDPARDGFLCVDDQDDPTPLR